MEWTDDATRLGLHRQRLAAACARLRRWCDDDRIPGAVVIVGRPDLALAPISAGRLRPGGHEPIDAETIFTVTSITKPIVASAAMLLLEEGRLSLGEKVSALIPEFRGPGRNRVRLWHLLSHTSGVPNLLPDDRELRRVNAPLETFLEAICRTELDFPPGKSSAYSSCGFLLLGEALARISGQPLPALLRERMFAPLGMNQTALGAPTDWLAMKSGRRFAEIRVPPEESESDNWNWNSRYWRTLGAPWGGLLSTAGDLAAFARMMLRDGLHGDERFLSPATVSLATGNALASMREIPETQRRCRPWGLGWRRQWPAQANYFGELASPETYGHWGASGTVLWVDPRRELYAVILTTQPQDPHGQYLTRLSNMILASA